MGFVALIGLQGSLEHILQLRKTIMPIKARFTHTIYRAKASHGKFSRSGDVGHLRWTRYPDGSLLLSSLSLVGDDLQSHGGQSAIKSGRRL